MLRKVRLTRWSRQTKSKLWAIPGALVVTWNTGGIDRCATRKERTTRAWTWRGVGYLTASILLVLLIAGLVALGFFLWLAVVATA